MNGAMELNAGDPPSGSKRLVRVTLAVLVLSLPLTAFVLAMELVRSHANIAYFEAVAQIIPIVILALAIELRYFSPQREIPAPLRPYLHNSESVRVIAFLYAAITLFALVVSEAISLLVIATQRSSQFTLSITTAGLVAGGVALVVAILLPSEGQAGGS